MNLYFIRHGETESNLKKVHQGSDVPLSERGKKQAQLLANRFKGVSVDIVYSSPYLRAKQTAEIMSQKLRVSIEYWEQLQERRRPSEVEGLSYDDLKASEINKITRKNQTIADWKYSDDESYNDLLKRAKNVEAHLLRHHKNQNVLCISHIGIMMLIVLQVILKDKLTPEVFWQFYHHSGQSNTGITHLEYTDENGWKLVTWNDATHL